MKKIILTIAAVAGASLSAYSQGQTGFDTFLANGYVVVDTSGHLSTSTASYSIASSFTAELWALPGPANTTAGLAGLDQYGYLNPIDLVSDGFSQVANVGNVAGSDGDFYYAGLAQVPGTVNANTVLAVVCWDGPATTFAQAIPSSADIGILAFVNPIGAASPNPVSANIATGWNELENSPACAANGGIDGSTQDLIMAPVPEPATLALAALGGGALLLFRRRE